ncbi:hypothetical protein D3C81_1748740 [compost metagenome]
MVIAEAETSAKPAIKPAKMPGTKPLTPAISNRQARAKAAKTVRMKHRMYKNGLGLFSSALPVSRFQISAKSTGEYQTIPTKK